MPLETSRLSIGELLLTPKGAKQVPIFDSDQPLFWRPGKLNVLWQPKAFNDPDASRVAICFSSTEEVEAYLSALDAWVIKAMAAAPRKYFGQDLTLEQIKERYTPALKTTQKGYTHLRAKMNCSGRTAVRCWSAETRAKTDQPADWTTVEVQPSLQIKGLWIMNKDFGLLIEMTDALIFENAAPCPF
jgi:hypothetical protein